MDLAMFFFSKNFTGLVVAFFYVCVWHYWLLFPRACFKDFFFFGTVKSQCPDFICLFIFIMTSENTSSVQSGRLTLNFNTFEVAISKFKKSKCPRQSKEKRKEESHIYAGVSHLPFAQRLVVESKFGLNI